LYKVIADIVPDDAEVVAYLGRCHAGGFGHGTRATSASIVLSKLPGVAARSGGSYETGATFEPVTVSMIKLENALSAQNRSEVHRSHQSAQHWPTCIGVKERSRPRVSCLRRH
jgi:hypothetical protein